MVRQAAANRDDARSTFKRAEQLSGRGLMSKVDYDTADTRLKVAEANYQAALENARSLKAQLQDRRASFELAQKKVADAVVRAPVAGSVSERLVQPGEYIRENTPVAMIVQMNPLKLKTAIQERYAGVIRPGQLVQFTVEAFPDRMFVGKIAYVSPAVDQATRTFPVEAMVENADRDAEAGLLRQRHRRSESGHRRPGRARCRRLHAGRRVHRLRDREQQGAAAAGDPRRSPGPARRSHERVEGRRDAGDDQPQSARHGCVRQAGPQRGRRRGQ